MNTCDTCKHWGAVRYPLPDRGKKPCGHIQDGNDDRGVPGDESILAVHDGNFLSDFLTGPKFGCIHWSKKE